jgi:hypothetical protein
MFDGNFVFPATAENKQLISVCHAAPCGIFAKRPVSKAFHHGPISDGKRLFPDKIPMSKSPSASFVQADDFSGEVNQCVASAVSGGNVHAMNSRHSPRFCQPVKFANRKSVMIEKLIVIAAIAHIFFV